VTDNGVQLDLFGEVERREAVAAQRIAGRGSSGRGSSGGPGSGWRTPAAQARRGDEATGWECPDCGGIELNARGLDREHDWDQDRPGERPGPQCQEAGECLRQWWNRTPPRHRRARGPRMGRPSEQASPVRRRDPRLLTHAVSLPNWSLRDQGAPPARGLAPSQPPGGKPPGRERPGGKPPNNRRDAARRAVQRDAVTRPPALHAYVIRPRSAGPPHRRSSRLAQR
jgi:hypothetical protein